MAVSFDAPELLHIFPTLLWRADLKPAEFEPLSTAMLKALAELRRAPGGSTPWPQLAIRSRLA